MALFVLAQHGANFCHDVVQTERGVCAERLLKRGIVETESGERHRGGAGERRVDLRREIAAQALNVRRVARHGAVHDAARGNSKPHPVCVWGFLDINPNRRGRGTDEHANAHRAPQEAQEGDGQE
eukprot:2993021-Prymnesium_polylepis.4